MGHWEVAELPMGQAPSGKGWEPFSSGIDEGHKVVFWRRKPGAAETDELYTTPEVCSALKVTPLTLTRMVERGDLPEPVLIGNRKRWSARAVDGFKNRANHAGR